MFRNKRKQLESWLNVPVTMEACNKNVEGMIKYGVRLPIRSALIPLQECDVDSKEKIEGEKPAYWFVNDEKALKIKLFIYKIKNGEIKGIGKDSDIFKYKIKRT